LICVIIQTINKNVQVKLKIKGEGEKMSINVKDRIEGYLEKNRKEKEFRERLFALDTTPELTVKAYKLSKSINRVSKFVGVPFFLGATISSVMSGELDSAVNFGAGAVAMAFTAQVSKESIGFLEDKALRDNILIYEGIKTKASSKNNKKATESNARTDTFEKLMFNK